MTEKILLIDDEPGIRKVLSISLADSGYEVITAESGEEGLELFRENRPIIVLTDIKMPGMDGIELLQQIKREDPETEVIMITGHGDMDLAVKSLKLEATDFITKPISDEAIEVALKRARDRIETREKLRAYTENLEDMARQHSRRYQQLFHEAPCYITVQDQNLQLLEVNRRFNAHFGGKRGDYCYEVYKHRKTPCPECPVIRTFEDGKPHSTEMVVTTREGEQRHVLIRTAPIADGGGRVAQVMEMSTDITEIRQLQDHLASLGMLIGSISHGIKGMLTGLDGGMYLLDSGFQKENEEQIKEGWEVVKLVGNRIRNMVLNILYYAKERDLQWERVDVRSFAEELARIIAPKAGAHDIRFTSDIDESADAFEVDPGVLRSALLNILENALDACIEDKGKTDHQIGFHVRQTEEGVIFEIEDNGLGMDRETREKIFTLFFSSKGGRGTGLGLFISDKIIRQHNGAITVESSRGKGSRFQVKMPVKKPENGIPEKSGSTEASGEKKQKSRLDFMAGQITIPEDFDRMGSDE